MAACIAHHVTAHVHNGHSQGSARSPALHTAAAALRRRSMSPHLPPIRAPFGAYVREQMQGSADHFAEPAVDGATLREHHGATLKPPGRRAAP
jgi:hypothetical protein